MSTAVAVVRSANSAATKVKKICQQCGREFFITACRARRGNGSYCGRECHLKGFAHGKKATGDSNKNWKGGVKTCALHKYVHQQAKDHPNAVRGYVRQHILVAEKALGKLLPAGAQVHHVDRNRANNANSNLVICQDSAYHNLLHKRLRVLMAGGKPDMDKICAKCHGCLSFGNFNKYKASPDGRTNVCRECCSLLQRSYRRKAA